MRYANFVCLLEHFRRPVAIIHYLWYYKFAQVLLGPWQWLCERVLAFVFFSFALLEFMSYLMVLLLLLSVNCKQCGFVRQEDHTSSTTRLYYGKNHFPPVYFSLRASGKCVILNAIQCCICIYSLNKMMHLNCDSMSLPHSGIAHMLELWCLILGYEYFFFWYYYYY